MWGLLESEISFLRFQSTMFSCIFFTLSYLHLIVPFLPRCVFSSIISVSPDCFLSYSLPPLCKLFYLCTLCISVSWSFLLSGLFLSIFFLPHPLSHSLFSLLCCVPLWLLCPSFLFLSCATVSFPFSLFLSVGRVGEWEWDYIFPFMSYHSLCYLLSYLLFFLFKSTQVWVSLSFLSCLLTNLRFTFFVFK